MIRAVLNIRFSNSQRYLKEMCDLKVSIHPLSLILVRATGAGAYNMSDMTHLSDMTKQKRTKGLFTAN